MNKEEAVKAIKNGAIAALISGVTTTIFIIVAMTTDSGAIFELWNDPISLIDVAIIIVCSYGIYKKSRTASVFIFVYMIFSAIAIGIELEIAYGIVGSFIFMYFYAKAIQGTFVYHKIEKIENPNYKSPSKWLYLLSIPITLFFLLVTAALYYELGDFPSTNVISGNELSTKDFDTLVENDVVEIEDQIIYFYSEGVFFNLRGRFSSNRYPCYNVYA